MVWPTWLSFNWPQVWVRFIASGPLSFVARAALFLWVRTAIVAECSLAGPVAAVATDSSVLRMADLGQFAPKERNPPVWRSWRVEVVALAATTFRAAGSSNGSSQCE